MTDQETKDKAVHEAGKLLVAAFPGFFGSIKFNLHGNRQSVHANVESTIELNIVENKQFAG